MTTAKPDELAEMKRRINLTQAAAAWGYELDRRASCRSSVRMRRGEDIIVIGMDGDVWVFFSVTGSHKGTIIDLAQRVFGESLGHVRQRLRPWLDDPPSPIPPTEYVDRVRPIPRDQMVVLAAYEAAEAVDGVHPYLTTTRRIPPTLVASVAESDGVRSDSRGNVLFPHRDTDGGLIGFELKNQGFTGFSPGGRKGLWSVGTSDSPSLVVCETAIDALSYAAIRGLDGKRLVSVAGRMNPEQPALLRSAIEALPENGRVVIAVDHDEGGDRLAQAIREAFTGVGRGDLELVEDRPPAPGQDWNDALCASPPTPAGAPGPA